MPLVLEPSIRDGVGPLSIDADGVVPERLGDLDAVAVARMLVSADGRRVPLGDLFRIGGSAADGRIECRGDFSRVHRLGAGMRTGAIAVVSGSVGRHAAEGMAGGCLTVAGDAGDWLAAGMRGGTVIVSGNAGDNAAAALPGEQFGVRGGLIVVNGSAGCLAGARMRRGILGIGGSCGEAPAFEMRAGTVVVAGRVGRRPGLGMRRGSLIALTAPPEIPPTFSRGTAWTPAVIPLLAGRLLRAGFRPASPFEEGFAGPWRHWHGDMASGGRGEIFHR